MCKDVGDLHNNETEMTYTKAERKEIADNIREFLKQEKKEEFFMMKRGREEHPVKREDYLTWYDRDRLENVARDVEGRITHYES
tara:strand:+ start:496 stop:747 length:252 start_codon:yes stop_codon:yes gene_type:complete